MQVVEYRADQIKKLIEERKEKDNWEFLFLGANIDAIGAAQNIGIDSSRAVRFKSDKKGTAKNYEVLNEAIKEIYPDYSLIRRYLVDYKFIERDNYGRMYRIVGEKDE